MSAASIEEPQVNDDLTAIGGIGPTRASVLRDAGIRTYQDLAALSVDKIDAILRAGEQFVSRDDIEGWISEAQELAEGGPSDTVGSKWHVAASFVVEFQTREEDGERRTKIHHVEQDVDERWPDFEHQQLCQWMMAQLGEPLDEVPEDLRAQAMQALEEELQQERVAKREAMQAEHARAQQELEDELKAQRARRQKQIDRELEQRRKEAQETLRRDLEQRRSQAQSELDDELAAERARRQEQIEQDIQERKAQAEQELAQDLRQRRESARRELTEELEAERARIQEEIDRDLERRRTQVEQTLEQELERMRAEARESSAARPEEEAPPPAEAEAEVRAAPRPAVAVAPGRVVVAQRPELTLIELRMRQPPQADRPRVLGTRPASPDTFRGDAPFAVALSLSLDESQVDELAEKGVTFTAQFRARERPSGDIVELGVTPPQRVVAGRSSYEAKLGEVTLPAGLYQLGAYVSISTSPPGGAYREMATVLMS